MCIVQVAIPVSSYMSLNPLQVRVLFQAKDRGPNFAAARNPEVWLELIGLDLAKFHNDNPRYPLLTEAGKYLVEFWSEAGLHFEDEIAEVLGAGGYGGAFLLNDGTVLKITTAPNEKACVKGILEADLVGPHLPVIYETYSFGLSPWFAYRREELDDLPEDIDFYPDISPIGKYFQEVYGLSLSDAHPENFGIRPNDPRNPYNPATWVLRDVSCFLY